MEVSSKWYKEGESDKIWWLDNGDETVGEFIFSFDQKTEYNLFADFPHKLSPDQVKIFIKENPYWASYFADRLEAYQNVGINDNEGH